MSGFIEFPMRDNLFENEITHQIIDEFPGISPFRIAREVHRLYKRYNRPLRIPMDYIGEVDHDDPKVRVSSKQIFGIYKSYRTELEQIMKELFIENLRLRFGKMEAHLDDDVLLN
ncbi:hypothetical protein GF406_12080 [candidate division KSB1 bacterium]|nr:hypothetical protein [candidate division KSB1 bacterium]